MLTFILGPSGSGKSRRMLAELRARAHQKTLRVRDERREVGHSADAHEDE